MKFSIDQEDLRHIWDKAGQSLTDLKFARIFITGGTGFFGHWLLESIGFANQFLGTNITVIVLTRNINEFLIKSPQFASLHWLNFLEGDLLSFPFQNECFTHLIHAATNPYGSQNQLSMFDTLALGTKRILDFARYTQVKKLLLTSSGAVYRPTFNIEKIPETWTGRFDPLDSSSSYAIGKLAAEHFATLYFKEFGLNIKIARCFTFIGPYLPLTSQFAMGNFIKNVINKENIQITGNKAAYRSYLYAADLIIWLWTILCMGTSGKTYNVGSEFGLSISDLAEIVASQVRDKQLINSINCKYTAWSEDRYIPDTRRAQEELKLKQWVDLETAIQKTMHWFLNKKSLAISKI